MTNKQIFSHDIIADQNKIELSVKTGEHVQIITIDSGKQKTVLRSGELYVELNSEQEFIILRNNQSEFKVNAEMIKIKTENIVMDCNNAKIICDNSFEVNAKQIVNIQAPQVKIG